MGDRIADPAAGAAAPARARAATRESVEADLDMALRAGAELLARASGCPRVAVWGRRAGGAPKSVWDRSGAGVAPSEDAYALLAALPGAADLGARATDAVSRATGFSAAAPIGCRERDAVAVLLVGGPDDVPGRVRPRTLRALAEAARRLEAPAAAAAAHARLCALDAEVRRLDRLAALGELLAEVVHEVRNPLVSVKTFLQLLAEGRDDADLRTRFVDVVGQEVRRIERLVETVLDQSRPPGAGARDAAADVRAALSGVALLLGHRATERGVEVEVDAAPTLPSVAMAEDALRQVALNLAVNAIDATPAGGRVRLRARRVPGGVEIAVEDQGRGVPRVLRERVFEPFFSTKPGRAGGLGLAISRRLVEEAGGEIALSDRPGGGSAFRVRLRSAGGRSGLPAGGSGPPPAARD